MGRNVYAITAAEKGKMHTALSCVSASGYALPPMLIYPRKRCVPETLKEGAVPNTLFENSENGWNFTFNGFNLLTTSLHRGQSYLYKMAMHHILYQFNS